MRCLLCSGEMLLMKVVKDETMIAPGFEHHTYMCSACSDIERRFVFNRHGIETEAVPTVPARPIAPASTIQHHRTVQGFLRRGLAKIRGA